MDIFKGQKLKSKYDAVDIQDGCNPNDPKAKIKYPKGTEVEVIKIQNDVIWLKFPDEQVIATPGLQVLQVYEKTEGEKLLTRTTKGSGTPPKALFSMMPESADWTMNYGWSVVLSLEPLGRKEWICQDCYTELQNTEDGTTVQCPECQEPKKPVNIDSILGPQLSRQN